MTAPLPFAAARDGVTLAVRLQPKSSADRIAGLAETADGGVALKICVTAAPEDGKANAALLKLVARTLKLPGQDLALVQGAKDRRKLIHISGAQAPLLDHLEDCLRPWLTRA